jgi:tight adherence protein B
VVVEEMPSPVSHEFGIAYEQQNLGVPIEQSLKNMLKRMPNLDLKFFVTAVAIQRQSGGDLAEILDKIGYIIRERFKIMGQVQALTGEGRLSGVVLMALPILLFFTVYYMNPEYVMLLFTDDFGRQMIAGAAILQVLGAVSIKKIITIKI